MNFHFPSSLHKRGMEIRCEVGFVPLRTMPSFANIDELAELESPSVSTEYHAELGRLIQILRQRD